MTQSSSFWKYMNIFIKQFSLRNAEKVRAEIIATTDELSKNPEKYPPDKYKLN